MTDYDYVLTGDPDEPGTIHFFSLTPLQQIQLREWVMSKGFGVNWVNRIEIVGDRAWISVFQWVPTQDGSGWTRMIDESCGLLAKKVWAEAAEDFPHPDLIEALSFKGAECSEYSREVHDLQFDVRALEDLCNRRGEALKRIVEGRG